MPRNQEPFFLRDGRYARAAAWKPNDLHAIAAGSAIADTGDLANGVSRTQTQAHALQTRVVLFL